jgi:hypothetical protein
MFTLQALLPKKVGVYLAASVDEKRRILAEEVDPVPFDLTKSIAKPLRIDEIEWFATRADLCRAMATLHAAAGRPDLAPIQEILALNPQAPLDPAAWPYCGFKGGDELGVLSGAWLLRRADDRWFSMSVGLADPTQAIDENTATALIAGASELLTASR